MKRLFFIFLIFLGFFSSAAWARNTHHLMKLVFPFGELERHHSSVCSIHYRTLDGCCEPPHTPYTHSQRVGCCYSPNTPLTVGSNTRCCLQPAANQTRWNQTETSPCGQFCTQPSVLITSFGTSSCCAALPTDQNRWGQTSSALCGGYCPPTSSVFTYGTLNSCCSSCGETIALQSVGNVCGTCCASCDGKRWEQTASNCGTCCHSLSAYYSGTCIEPCQDLSYAFYIYGATCTFPLVNSSYLISVFGPYSYDYQLTISGYVDNCYMFMDGDRYIYNRCYAPHPNPAYIHTHTFSLPKDTRASFFIKEINTGCIGNYFGFRGTITMTCP